MKTLFIEYHSQDELLSNFLALKPPSKDAVDARERAVERIKFELDTKYRLHPNNFVKRGDFKKHCICVSGESWDETRIDRIGSNGDGFPAGSHYAEL